MNNRNKAKDLLKKIKFKYLNLNISYQIVIILSILGIISLFMPWIINAEGNAVWNSFNSISWNIWYILITCYIILIFSLISSSYQEKIKLYTDISVKNYFLIISTWLFSLFFWIISISFIAWLSTLWQDYSNWKWLIFCMTIWIILIICWFFIRKSSKKTNSEVILEQLNQNREKIKEDNNMTLPI